MPDSPLQDYSIPDPALTPLGFGPQCADLAAALRAIPLRIDLIVVSPMLRTLQTAQQALGWRMDEGAPVILAAEWQENSDKPCDTGSDVMAMAAKWPQFDWTSVDSAFPAKTGLYEFSKEGLTRRGIEVRRWLRNRPEAVVAVVSHSGFLRVGVSYCGYGNADFRIFDFARGPEHDEVGGRLIEWELTKENGGGLGKSEKGVFGWETQTFPKKKGENHTLMKTISGEKAALP